MEESMLSTRLSKEHATKMKAYMKKHKIKKKSEFIRVAIDALEKQEKRRERGEIVIEIPDNLRAFLKLERKTGVLSYSHIICNLLRSHYQTRLKEIEALANDFEQVHKRMVSVPDEQEDV
jgi:Arc/MetJ-type ribon-helix-helix transcriptional regulator